ncbi:hypothetical protein L208DRAFT_1316095 [Tricholoma matsutake]|nr:hypothetical protein L208DRAFT_1316095 [Tricholoma matsutake 945]
MLNFPLVPFAIDLLNAMEETPDFKNGPTPHLTATFLSRIENANPNSPDISEDDSGSSWGHLQFTSGNMSI